MSSERSEQAFVAIPFCPGCGAPGVYRPGRHSGNTGDDTPARVRFRCGTVFENPHQDTWIQALPHIPRSEGRSWACQRIAEWKRLVARLESA